MKYIQRVRRRIIREKIKSDKASTISEDHGYLLVGETTGENIKTNTLTTELNKLSVAAGLKDVPSHAHLFRNAYITQKLKAIIEKHHLENKDDFRKALLNTEAFKQEVQQWTGHSDVSSLDTYIDLAFAGLSNMDKVFSAVHLEAAVNSVQVSLDDLKAEIKAGDATLPELLEHFEGLIGAFQEEIDGCLEDRKDSATTALSK